MGYLLLKNAKKVTGMNTEQNNIMTYHDFPMFYENPIIKKLSENEKWTVSTTKSPDPSKKDKMPIDMHALIHNSKVWGCAFDRGYNPLVTLKTVCDAIPTAVNNTYYLDAIIDKIVVLDIEPGCPDFLKKRFMQMPFLYGEWSMSGRGLHLIFDFPEDIFLKYPDAQNKQVLKEKNGYYQILLNHMVTFTRNTIPYPEQPDMESSFRNMFEILASQAVPSKTAGQVQEIEDCMENIPGAETIIETLSVQKYTKTLTDFPQKGSKTGYDNSAYEFGMSAFYHRLLNSFLTQEPYCKRHYTDEEKALIIYHCIENNIEHRAKHDELRCGMPWLLFVAANVTAKT